MKNTIKLLLISLICTTTFVSCEDDDKASFQAIIGLENQAGYVRVLVSSGFVLDVSKLAETSITFDYSTTGDKPIETYSMSVTKNGLEGDPAHLFTTTEFPATFTISMTEIASAMGITLDDIFPADVVTFSGVSTSSDGTVTTGADLGGDLVGQPEQHNAYSFAIAIFCAPVAGDVAGTWVLDLIDTYGDGWDGAFITSHIDGSASDYTVASGSGAQHEVEVPSGSTLVWTYTSGSWEGEHVFTMIGPDGTVYGEFWGGVEGGLPFCFF